ncbi:MAG: tRNA lysidine(34) synthetase TilS [Wenzhouxiangella sp.]
MNQDTLRALDYPLFPTRLPGQGRVLIAFSGGPDSLCLAALACEHWADRSLLAIHVDHGQDKGSAERARQAEALANQLGLASKVVRVELNRRGGPEAAARRARYQVFERELGIGDTLLMAHHADDQAETVLLRLLRGAGPAGLAGMPVTRPLGQGRLYRPLLAWRRQQILSELSRRQLEGLQDPHNQRLDLDRNYLRHRILPQLDQRWPGAAQRLLRSARLCRESAAEMARLVEPATQQQPRLPDRRAIPSTLRGNAFGLSEFIRHWLRCAGLPTPPGRPLDEFVRQLGQQRPDRHPALQWDKLVLKSYRDTLWLEPAAPRSPENWQLNWLPSGPLPLPGALGKLIISGPAADQLPGLIVRDGRPGDRIQADPGGPTRAVKTLLHEAGIPPWQRKRWPRLVAQGRLLALGDRWLDPEFARQLETSGSRFEWQRDSTQRSTQGHRTDD